MSATVPILDSEPPPRPVASDDVPRRWAVPWGLLGMLGLMVAIENSVVHHVLDFSDPVSLSWLGSAAPGPPATKRPPRARILLRRR